MKTVSKPDRLSRESRPLPGDSSLRHAAIPFLGASFATDLALFLVLWPVWWLLGVEQLIPPLFLVWESLLYFLRTEGSLKLHTPVVWSLLFSVWYLVPFPWVPTEDLDLYARGVAVVFAQTLILFLFSHEVKAASARNLIERGLGALALVLVGGTVVALVGGPTIRIPSVLGMVLPGGMITSSEFWANLAVRSVAVWGGGWLPFRVSSLALKPSALSSLCLLLIPFTALGMRTSSPVRRLAAIASLSGLVLSLALTESRAAYAAAICGAAIYLALRTRTGATWARLLPVVPVLLAALSVVVMLLLSGQRVPVEAENAVTSLRPESWAVRAQVYEETFNLLFDHPIAGWGVAVPIPGLERVYSAGSHSGFLTVLFQHGVVGLFLYLGLWMSVLRRLASRFRNCRLEERRRLAVLASALVALLVREVADGWNWDLSSAMVVWIVWGLSIVKTPMPDARAFPAGEEGVRRATSGQQQVP